MRVEQEEGRVSGYAILPGCFPGIFEDDSSRTGITLFGFLPDVEEHRSNIFLQGYGVGYLPNPVTKFALIVEEEEQGILPVQLFRGEAALAPF